jgi:HK97 family phage prohead protease
MQHKTLQTKARTTTEAGEFTAIAAAYSVDRVNDAIIPGAFAKSISQWQDSGKKIPLHWDHEGSADSIIGSVDPASMREVKEGLFVAGRLDIEASDVAKEAWRSVKNNAVALSFGYLATKQRKRRDGVNELLEIDLYEVSIVPAPANPDTKFLSYKSVEVALDEETERLNEDPDKAVDDGCDDEPERAKSAPQDPLRKRSDEVALALASEGLPPGRYTEPPPPPEVVIPDERELRRRSDEARLRIAGG